MLFTQLLHSIKNLLASLLPQRLWQKTKHSDDSSTAISDYSGMILTPLTKLENKLFKRGFTPVSTITWFQCRSGGSDDDHNRNYKHAVSILKQRVEAIVKKNPWLAGQIILQQECKKKNKDNKSSYLAYTTIVDDSRLCSKMCTMFHVIDEDDDTGPSSEMDSIHRHTPAEEIARILSDANILLKPFCEQQKDKALWKVIILPPRRNGEEGNSFAVIVSMSHILADGHTFYSLHNALLAAPSSEVMSIIPKLDPKRIETTMQQQEEALGSAEFNFSNMPGLLFTILRGLLLTKLVGPIPWLGDHLRVHTRYFAVDTDKIQRIKKEEVVTLQHEHGGRGDEPSFVSTNDIVTSWILNHSGCNIGRMAIDLRGRLSNHTKLHAGNYDNVLFYRVPQDTVRPLLIRKSIQSLKRINTASEPPTNMELLNSNITLISNWASFSDANTHNNILVACGCKQELHLPLFDVSRLCPSTLAVCVIFQARPDRLGVMVTATPERMSKVWNGIKKNKDSPFLVEDDPLFW